MDVSCSSPRAHANHSSQSSAQEAYARRTVTTAKKLPDPKTLRSMAFCLFVLIRLSGDTVKRWELSDRSNSDIMRVLYLDCF